MDAAAAVGFNLDDLAEAPDPTPVGDGQGDGHALPDSRASINPRTAVSTIA